MILQSLFLQCEMGIYAMPLYHELCNLIFKFYFTGG